MRAKLTLGEDGHAQRHIVFFCPGCEEHHVLPINPGWRWNGDLALPTLAPSVRVTYSGEDDGKPVHTCCHSFVRDGRIEFLSDCTHKMAGLTVDLPEVTSWSQNAV